jgi:hypothetical protein
MTGLGVREVFYGTYSKHGSCAISKLRPVPEPELLSSLHRAWGSHILKVGLRVEIGPASFTKSEIRRSRGVEPVFVPTRFRPVKSSAPVQVSLNAPAILRPIRRGGLTQVPLPPQRKPGFGDETLSAHPPIAEVSPPGPEAASQNRLGEIDPLYLFACRVEWERRGDPSSAW